MDGLEFEGGMDPHYPHFFSATTGPSQSSSRRQHLGQPPTLLTTSSGGLPTRHLHIPSGPQTPLSTTSLSTPFSSYPSSSLVLSPGAEARPSSPMATRSPPSLNTPYNPQQWGPLSSSTSSLLEDDTRARHRSQSSRFPRFAPRPLGPDGMTVEDPTCLQTIRCSHR